MNKTITALFIVHENATVLAPSKANHRLIGQIDPLSCSYCFGSEVERVNYIKNILIGDKFCGKNFHPNFNLISTPIKFNHSDGLGQKLFTGYIATIRNKDILKNGFIIDPSEMWVNMDELEKNRGFTISPMFKRAITFLSEEMAELQKKV
mgnify:CR=1 FL=1